MQLIRRLISFPDFQTGICVAAHVTLDNRKIIYSVKTELIDTVASLQDSDRLVIPVSEVHELLTKIHCVVSDFLMNKINFVGGDKLLPVFKHGFLRSEENVFPAIFYTQNVCGKIFSFTIFNIYVWLVLLPYM